MENRTYHTPEIELIRLDTEILLALQSELPFLQIQKVEIVLTTN